VSSHGVFGRLLGFGMRHGSMRMVLLGGVRRARFSRVRRRARDVRMRDLGRDRGSRQSQGSRKRQQLPDHVLVFGRE